jgi:glycosyltransferase involved in cell wall biosynthesis
MKVFYFLTKSEAGGVQTHIFQLSNFMRSLGHDVMVMAYPGGWLELELKKIGDIFYPNPYLTNAVNPIADLRAAAILKKALADFRPDLVSCHSTKAGIIGRLTIRNCIPTIFTAHGWGFTEGVPFFRKIPIVILEKIASNFCHKIICVSEYDRQLALKYKIAPEIKLITIHNGVEINEINVDFRKSKSSNEYQLKIIFVGRLTNQKDPILLLEAFGSLPEEIKMRVNIEIIGEGPLRKKVEKAIQDLKLEHLVKLRGNLPRQEVLLALKNADIFVLTTNYEGFPRSILEAMSVGLPIIATDVGGVREAITPECGILVPRGDKNALILALKKLISDSELRKNMDEKSFERCKNYFSLQKMLEKTYSVYREVLSLSVRNQFQ